MPLQTSPENPAPLREINARIAEWVNRLGSVWVEGQITQLTARSGMAQVFIELRDLDHNLSARVVASSAVMNNVKAELTEGDRVVAFVKPQFFPKRGQLVLRADEIRTVGIGDLLARVERLRASLHQEGLFSPSRKSVLPFLPRRIGLICGRNSAAERDVIENVERRWPNVEFEIREVAVQGSSAATEVGQALIELDDQPTIDVIVIARGGGNVEDLLPFSDEALVRAVAAASTPVVSAIGHEQDAPLLDFVADVRASTPTDAARLIVPNFTDEAQGIAVFKARLQRSLANQLDREIHRIASFRAHPLLASPTGVIDEAAGALAQLERRISTALLHRLQLASTTTEHQRLALRAFSPGATLARGYAIVTTDDGAVARNAAELTVGGQINVRLHRGRFSAVIDTIPEENNG